MIIRMFCGLLPRFVRPIVEDGGGGGGTTTHWSEQQGLPENVRGWDEVKGAEDSDKFWGQMSEMRSHMGQSIRIPGEDAGKEDWIKFNEKMKAKVPTLMETPDFENDDTLQGLYSKMGRPEKAEDYQIPEIKNADGDVIDPKNIDFSLAENFKEIAFKRGVSKKHYAEMVTDITQLNLTAHAGVVAKQKEDHDLLQKEWGSAMQQNSDIVNNFLSKVNAPQHVVDAVKGGNADTATMTWFHKLATQTLGKGSEFQTDVNNNPAVMTPDEATLRIGEIRNNKTHPFNDKSSPGHAAAIKKMQELYYLKNPKSGTQAAPGTVFEVGGPK